MKRKTTKRALKLKRNTVARLDKLEAVAGGQVEDAGFLEGYGFSLNRNNCGTSANG